MNSKIKFWCLLAATVVLYCFTVNLFATKTRGSNQAQDLDGENQRNMIEVRWSR